MDSTVLILAIAIGVLFIVIVALIIVLLAQRLRKPRHGSKPDPSAPVFKPLRPGDRFRSDDSPQLTPPGITHFQEQLQRDAPVAERSLAVPPLIRMPLPSARPADTAVVREALIACIAGPQQGKQAKFATPKITIGRDPKSNIVLSDLFVSQHHAEIKLEGGHVTLEDLNSAHGTWADGKRVMQAPLTEHMQFRIGQSVFALVLPGRGLPAPNTNEARFFAHEHQPVLPFLADYVLDETDEGETLGPLTVFKAHAIKQDTRANTSGSVWVKYLSKPTFADNAFFRAKFEQQIAIGQTIVHPHCARIYGGDSRAAIPYIIEQRLVGGTLADRLRVGQALGDDEITHVIGQLCNALSYLHKRNIVHQAITPEAIAFDLDNKVYLTHCGFARVFSEPHVTSLGVFTGDPRYLAAEQLRGDTVGLQADLYALGVIAHQMATGHLPYEAEDGSENAADMIRKHLETRLQMPRKLNNALTDYMSLALMKALDRDPMHRFANAREMAKSFGYTEQFVASKDATGLMFMPRNLSAYPLSAQNSPNPYDYGRRPAPQVAMQAVLQLKLKNISNGAIVVIAGPRTVITRELINTADNMISRTNGQLYQHNGTWHLAELPEAMSANGLFINNVRVTEPRAIKVGDQIRFGKTTLKVIN